MLLLASFVVWNWGGLRIYRNSDVINLYARISILEEKVKEARAYSNRLESEIESLKKILYALTEKSLQANEKKEEDDDEYKISFDTLLVCGSDQEICNSDRNALMRSGVEFRMLRGATALDFDAEIRRRRRDGSMYKRVHFAMHSSPAGLIFDDKLVDGQYLADHLAGVELVFLAGCKSAKIADDISGVVPYVVVTYDDVKNNLASDFVYNFWSVIADGGSPEQAYRTSLDRTPQIAQSVDMRVG